MAGYDFDLFVIGGGSGGSVDGITIEGTANIEAYGSAGGAGGSGVGVGSPTSIRPSEQATVVLSSRAARARAKIRFILIFLSR